VKSWKRTAKVPDAAIRPRPRTSGGRDRPHKACGHYTTFPFSRTTRTIVLSLELRLRFLLLPAVDSQVFNIGCNRPANLISAVKLEVKAKVANCPTQT
jgi:hypothetical protein